MNPTNDIIAVYRRPFKTVMTVLPGEINYLPPGVIPCLRLSSGTADSFRNEFGRINALTKNFIICWDEDYFDEALSELLVHSLFSTNYQFINNRPVVIIGTDISAPAADLLQERLAAEITLQGFHELLLWRNDNTTKGTERFSQPVFINSVTRIGDDWLKTNLFRDLGSLTNHFIFDFDIKAEAVEKQQLLDNACKSFLSSQPVIANSLNDYLSLKNRVAQLSSDHQQISERFLGAEKTIGVIRSKYKDDYENLFKWYHNEYEILPLWYKRFGHILKVILGRRSFRSLFSDDVKKYKN
ncbi:hypothetical protein [Flavitalea sp.]|nr:hypothetical protein [Flavitalea sp.]